METVGVVGIVGLGLVGRAIAARLEAAGFSLVVVMRGAPCSDVAGVMARLMPPSRS